MKVEVERIEDGVSHGDHWDAMYGFADDTHDKIEQSFQDLILVKELESNLSLYRADYGVVSHVALVKDEGLVTLFPSLPTDRAVPFGINKIVEWEVTDGLEAHIEGSGRETFGLGFFATDYVENYELYKKGELSEVALSAFAYVLDRSSLGEEGNSSDESELLFASNFCGYFPSSELNTGFDYDFVGIVLSLNYFDYQDEKFALLDVQLIQDEELNFVLPMAVNLKNMREKDIKVGDSITGAFWLQGKIVR